MTRSGNSAVRALVASGVAAVAVCWCGSEAGPAAVLEVDLSRPKAVTPIEYGFHYEEIGMMGEGGLHAELVRNRALEEANPPAGLEVSNGRYVGVPGRPEGRKRPYRQDPLVGWEPLPGGGLALERVATDPLNHRNPHSLRVTLQPRAPGDPPAGLRNTGFFGMHFREGVACRLSLFARADDFEGGLRVELGDGAGGAVSEPVRIDGIGRDWRRFTATLTPARTVPRGTLRILPLGRGSFQLDVVSLLPSDTWDGGRSVFRSDIMRHLADYAPDFIRFPGGCVVHGVSVGTIYRWKDTIGPAEQRPGAWSKWPPHYRTDGLGYHEFLQLCEYLGADAMFVAPTGMVCTGWVPRVDGEHRHPPTDVDEFVADALDAVEYALGPVDSRWGAERARNGHPEPFPLKFLEVGNEDFGPEYYRRYDRFQRAIRARHPGLGVIANSIIGDFDDKRSLIAEFADPASVTIFDEHYYKPLSWVIDNRRKFDAYPRPGPDLFIGELGIAGGYPDGVLGEGILMMDVERNGDLRPMIADRPLMRHWEFTGGRTRDPLLLHTASTSVRTFNFHLSKLFRDHKIDTWLPAAWSAGGDPGAEREVFASAGLDRRAGSFILKLVHLGAGRREVALRVGPHPRRVPAVVTTLNADPGRFNSPETPGAVAPRSAGIEIGLHGAVVLEPRSLTVIRAAVGRPDPPPAD